MVVGSKSHLITTTNDVKKYRNSLRWNSIFIVRTAFSRNFPILNSSFRDHKLYWIIQEIKERAEKSQTVRQLHNDLLIPTTIWKHAKMESSTWPFPKEKLSFYDMNCKIFSIFSFQYVWCYLDFFFASCNVKNMC